MLSYMHGFHAGNHADVLKHMVLVATLEHMRAKETGFRVIDTHAGVGMYDLTGKEARRKREWESGIGQLWRAEDLTVLVQQYVDVVKSFQPDPDGPLKLYPGSPAIVHRMLRPQDDAFFFELHPAEHRRLHSWAADKRRPKPKIRRENGFEGSIGLVPPPTRRGLVLIDPPYEVKSDYAAAAKLLGDLDRRFATGTIILWYPVTTRERVDRLIKAAARTGVKDLWRFEMCVAPDTEDFGMTGSGLLVARPAWTLVQRIESALAAVGTALGVDAQTGHRIVAELGAGHAS